MVLEALEEGHGEAVGPDDEARVTGEPDHLLQLREVVPHVVEHQLAVVVGVGLRDDVQQVELVDAHARRELDDLVDVLDVLLVDHHIDVHDGAPGVADRADHGLHELLEGPRGLGQPVVGSSVWPWRLKVISPRPASMHAL